MSTSPQVFHWPVAADTGVKNRLLWFHDLLFLAKDVRFNLVILRTAVYLMTSHFMTPFRF